MLISSTRPASNRRRPHVPVIGQRKRSTRGGSRGSLLESQADYNPKPKIYRKDEEPVKPVKLQKTYARKEMKRRLSDVEEEDEGSSSTASDDTARSAKRIKQAVHAEDTAEGTTDTSPITPEPIPRGPAGARRNPTMAPTWPEAPRTPAARVVYRDSMKKTGRTDSEVGAGNLFDALTTLAQPTKPATTIKKKRVAPKANLPTTQDLEEVMDW